MQYGTLYGFGKAVIQHRIPNVDQLNAVIAMDSGKRNGLLKCLAGLVGEDVLVPLVKASIVHVKGHIRNGHPIREYDRKMPKKPEGISGLWGKEHFGVKGDDAIRLLLKEKNGHVKAAFHRNDIGDIDLIWGDETRGLAHIIKRRHEQRLDVARFLSALPDVIETGTASLNTKTGNIEIYKDRTVAVIAPRRDGSKIQFLLTSFRTRPRK